MKIFKKTFLSVLLAMAATTLCSSAMAAEWGTTPDIRVEGNHLVNTDGEQVMLHGIMDTPSPYFCGYRFTDGHWINVYNEGDQYITKCINYFNTLFTAATDAQQGSWCNVFRLHLDPCWTDNPNVSAEGFTISGNTVKDPNGNTVSGEADIRHFSYKRLTKYLKSLYLPIANKAHEHGMYVIMRPPGVCPTNIKVGDYYQQYLLKVWDEVSKDADVKAASGWLSLELANEPINVLDANGGNADTALRDFFQPIVNKIRENGFKGIIWVPGATWQQNYRPYATYPVKDDTEKNLGYAVHFYPGWYSTSDTQYDEMTSIRAFYGNVPVVKDYPIMITEVDWSPENPNGQGHYNESGQWVLPNYGTWATGSTSKFGKGYRAVLNYFGNIGMTLTHTHDYMDIDHYIATGILRPAFQEAMGGNAYEACSGACFQWYNEYAHQEHHARVWEDEGEQDMFPLHTTATSVEGNVFNPSIWETGSFDEATGKLTTGQYGFGGWQYATPLDLSPYNYVVVKLKQKAPGSGQNSPSFRLFDHNSYWSSPYITILGGKDSVAVPLKNAQNNDKTTFNPSHVYIAGFWTVGGNSNAIYIDKVYVSNDGVTPATGIDAVLYDSSRSNGTAYSITGQRITNPDSYRGIMIINGKKVIKKY